MARSKEFDPDAVINKALALFRQQGYEATSVDDLVQHLGIGRGSLYATFGSKHVLYIAPLDHYIAQMRSNDLPQTHDARTAIAALLYRQVDEALTAARLGGCLLVNSIAERLRRIVTSRRGWKPIWPNRKHCSLRCCATMPRWGFPKLSVTRRPKCGSTQATPAIWPRFDTSWKRVQGRGVLNSSQNRTLDVSLHDCQANKPCTEA